MSQTRITRKLRQGTIDIDNSSPCALIVNFVLEIVNVDESGRVVQVIEAKSESKIVQIDSSVLLLSGVKGSSVNVASIAAGVINSCKYIHPSRAEEVEQVLIKLRKTFQEKEKKSVSASVSVSETKLSDPPPKKTHEVAERLPPAYMDDVDAYLEMLYQVSTSTAKAKAKTKKDGEDGLPLQIKGTAMILQLCRRIDNLESLIQNSTLMGALARVLQEEYKKSTELTFNLLRIFLSFSNFAEMHCLLADYRIGLFTLKTIEFELKRAETRDAERADKVAQYEEEVKALSEEEDLGAEERRQRREKLQAGLESEHAKHRKFQQKQDKLLFAAFYVLLNLAEDLNVERKMIKKDIVKYLALCLGRTHSDLLLLVLTFLKKISVFEDNKDIIKRAHETGADSPSWSAPTAAKPIAMQLGRFVACSSPAVTTMALRMLFNLSFDKDLREQMIRAGVLPKAVSQLKVPALRSRLLKLLYHLSFDDKARAMFSYTEAVPLVMGMVINFPQKLLAKELAALAVNLSLHPKNAELMVQSKGLNLLMDRLVPPEDDGDSGGGQKDPLLVKVVRNISQWTFNLQQSLESPEQQYAYRGLWTPHIKTLVRVALEHSNNHDLLVEVFGVLANLTPMDLPANQSWAKMLNLTSEARGDMTLLDLMVKVLASGTAHHDMVLETALLIGTVTEDVNACKLIAKSGLIKTMFKLWRDYAAAEVEIHLQFLFAFYNLSTQPPTQSICFGDSKLLAFIIEYLSHKNEAVRSLAFDICEKVAESDRQETGLLGELGLKILKKRFTEYNQLWLLETEPRRDSYDDDYSGGISMSNIRRSSTFTSNMDDIADDEYEGGPSPPMSPFGRGGK